jgi:hypothetical protein
MDKVELRWILSQHFGLQGFSAQAHTGLGVDLLLAKPGERLGCVLCPDREEGMAYLGAFEAGMQRAVDARRTQPAGLQLALGLAFGATAAGQRPSYRRALNKYSNSIVFEDLGLSMFLVQGEGDVIILAPAEVNPFLRRLDRWITEHK